MDTIVAPLAAALTEIKRLKTCLALRDAGFQAGMIDPSDTSVIDPDTLGLDDRGEVTGAEQAVARLAQQRPYLFRPDTRATPPAPSAPPSAPRIDCLEMSDAQYAAHKAQWRNQRRK